MEVLHVYADDQITFVQGVGIFNLFEESWIKKIQIPRKEVETTNNTDLTNFTIRQTSRCEEVQGLIQIGAQNRQGD